ncbi:ABC transporter ATP-binding protein [Dethiothermospora halolimnae]|uniref:ABC transporter ATP-binding protein n=1 Tax=Dethiothermospora halolimnae TaxID=3114390 RepID=UPI003CCB7F1B
MENREKINGFVDAIKWMYNFGSQHKKWLFIAITASITLITVNIFKAFYTKKIITRALEGEFSHMVRIIVIFIAIMVFGILSEYISKYTIGKYAFYSTKTIKERLAIHLTKTTMKNDRKNQSGDLASRVNNDTQYVTNIMKDDFVNVGVQPLMALVALGYIMIINWKLGLISLIPVPILMGISYFLNKRMRNIFGKSYHYLGKGSGTAQEAIIGIDTLKTYHLENSIYKKAKKRYKQSYKKELEGFRYLAPMQAVGLSLAWSPRLICAFYGGYMALDGELEVGALVAVLQLLDYLAYPTAGFSWILSNVNRAIGAIDRINEIFNIPKKVTTGETIKVNDNKSAIKFDSVSFGYHGDKKVIDDLSFDLPQDKTFALVGASGSGKSTVIDLISRFYEYDKGKIEVFGNNIKNINIESLRNKIAVVSQDTYLFPGTITENILYGKENGSMDEVIEAAKLAYAHDFILDLDHGYNTVLGEGGINLSGGQRQRVAIARAFIKDAPILLLDEPTSSLDNYTEAKVQQSLERLMNRKTVLIIAHRLSTVIKADKIIVLKEGKVLESGTHRDLIDKNSYYRQLYKNKYSSQGEENKGELNYA